MAASRIKLFFSPSQLTLVQGLRWYARNPLEGRSFETLMGATESGRGGRGGRGRKKGGKKFRTQRDVKLGHGKNNIRWGGLSYSLASDRHRYGFDWLQDKNFGMQQATEDSELSENGSLDTWLLEGERKQSKYHMTRDWSEKGWTGASLNGRHVGHPQLADGRILKDFSSTIIEFKRVANQTRAGKKRTISCLVVVGNGNGVVGYAVGRAEETVDAVRKAKNKAVHALQYIPRYKDHTVYHNLRVKFCKTTLLVERKVPGSGLSCHRAVHAICQLAGIKDLRTKIIGSTNPLNVVQATLKALTSQETHQSVADEENKFLVEFHAETMHRPIVVSVPQAFQTDTVMDNLRDMQLVAHN